LFFGGIFGSNVKGARILLKERRLVGEKSKCVVASLAGQLTPPRMLRIYLTYDQFQADPKSASLYCIFQAVSSLRSRGSFALQGSFSVHWLLGKVELAHESGRYRCAVCVTWDCRGRTFVVCVSSVTSCKSGIGSLRTPFRIELPPRRARRRLYQSPRNSKLKYRPSPRQSD